MKTQHHADGDAFAVKELATTDACAGSSSRRVIKILDVLKEKDITTTFFLTGRFIEKRLGCRGTARNMTSLKRILAKMEEFA